MISLQEQADAKLREREREPALVPIDPMVALSQWIVTEKQVQEMEETELIWRRLIASSHLAAWVGPAGCGKSAIARHAAGETAKQGLKVFYFQEDAPAGDIPAMHEHAKEHGYVLLNSTLTGSSPKSQLDALYALVATGSDMRSYVLIFDTLKKYVDLMNKGGAREFFALLRALTQRGATVILLGHTNKHLGSDGKPIFEGVGDVRNDTDELIYLDATEKDHRGVITITLRPDKTRCAIEAATFELDTTTMTVRPLDRVIDVQEQVRQRRQRDEDGDVIQAIDELLGSGMNRTELVDKAAQACGHGAKAVRKVLDRYCSEDKTPDALWLVTHFRVNNVRHVSRNPSRSPPLPNGKTSEPAEPAERAEPGFEHARH